MSFLLRAKNRYLEFLAKFSSLAYISLKNGYFELGHDYDVTVTSYLECWYLFLYLWKEDTPSYTMVGLPDNMYRGGSILSSQVGGNHPLCKLYYKKDLIGRRLSLRQRFFLTFFFHFPKEIEHLA